MIGQDRGTGIQAVTQGGGGGGGCSRLTLITGTTINTKM